MVTDLYSDRLATKVTTPFQQPALSLPPHLHAPKMNEEKTKCELTWTRITITSKAKNIFIKLHASKFMQSMT